MYSVCYTPTMSKKIAGAPPTEVINVRFPMRLLEEIESEVRNGRFSDRNQFIVTAVRDYLDRLHSRANK